MRVQSLGCARTFFDVCLFENLGIFVNLQLKFEFVCKISGISSYMNCAKQRKMEWMNPDTI